MNKMRRQYQRKFNKLIRTMNKNIAKDNFWKGRFEFRQKDASFEKFPDGSGGLLYVIIRGYDKITGYYKDFRIEYAPWLHGCSWELWEIANGFIVNDTKVWEGAIRPSLYNNFVKDCTNISIPEEVMRKPYNFYVTYEYWREGV